MIITRINVSIMLSVKGITFIGPCSRAFASEADQDWQIHFRENV